MSYKFDSLITILRKLDSREKVTVHSLMDALEVAERLQSQGDCVA